MTRNRSRPVLDDRAIEALLSGRTTPGYDDVASVVSLIAMAGCGPIPPPSAGLTMLLDKGFQPPPASPAASRRPRWVARVAVALGTALAATLTAATANALPPAVQHVVADVVEAVTPFALPRPTVAEPPGAGSPPLAPVRDGDADVAPTGQDPADPSASGPAGEPAADGAAGPAPAAGDPTGQTPAGNPDPSTAGAPAPPPRAAGSPTTAPGAETAPRDEREEGGGDVDDGPAESADEAEGEAGADGDPSLDLDLKQLTPGDEPDDDAAGDAEGAVQDPADEVADEFDDEDLNAIDD